MSVIYLLLRVYTSRELPIKAFRIEAEAKGEIAKLEKSYPDRSYDVEQIELVED